MNTTALNARLAEVRARRSALPSQEEAAAALIVAGKPVTVDVLLSDKLLELEIRALEVLLARDSRAAFLASEAGFIASAVSEADAILADPPGKSYEAQQRVDKARERVHMAAQKILAASRGAERIPTPHAYVDVLNRVSALSLLIPAASPVHPAPKEA